MTECVHMYVRMYVARSTQVALSDDQVDLHDIYMFFKANESYIIFFVRAMLIVVVESAQCQSQTSHCQLTEQS